MRVAEHTFVITGGASGLGAATAEHLVAQGAAVVLLDINQPAVEAAAERLGNKALGLACDICDAEQVQQALDTAVKQFGALHGLINCAGIVGADRKSTRLNSSHVRISYAVFCLKKKNEYRIHRFKVVLTSGAIVYAI